MDRVKSIIAKLNREGLTVKVRHFRYVEIDGQVIGTPVTYAQIGEYADENKDMTVSPKGGRTEVMIFDGETVVAEGVARCNPDLDTYNKHLGVEIALGRALMTEEEKERRKIHVKNRPPASGD